MVFFWDQTLWAANYQTASKLSLKTVPVKEIPQTPNIRKISNAISQAAPSSTDFLSQTLSLTAVPEGEGAAPLVLLPDLSHPAMTPLPLNSLGKTPDTEMNGPQGVLFINYDNPNTRSYDVDGDGTMAPSDVLAIVNYINAFGPGPVRDDFKQGDINGDGYITAADPLTIINTLNAKFSDPGTESVNLLQSFPNGIVIGLDNGGSLTTEALFEVTDIHNKKASVVLTGITAAQNQWKILPDSFSGVDTQKIKALAIRSKEPLTPQTLNIVLNPIVLDSTPPNLMTAINHNATLASSRQVELNLTAADATSGVDKMRFSQDFYNTFTDWEPFSESKSLELIGNEGDNWVIVQILDKAGNRAESWAKIQLDLTPPQVSFRINNDAPATFSRNIDLSLNATDNLSGLNRMRFSLDKGITWGVWENFSETKSLLLPDQEGAQEVWLQVEDKAGNAATLSRVIQYQKPKALYLLSAPYTDSAQYTLAYQFGDVKKQDVVTLNAGENTFQKTLVLSDGTSASATFKINLVPTLRQSERIAYDEIGNVKTRTDSQGKVVTYGYNTLDQLESVSGIEANPITFKYDKNGNRTEVNDAHGKTQYQYDNLNRLTKIIYPDSKTLTYEYELNGNLQKLIYPDNTVISYQYDANNRLKKVIQGTEITSYDYNKAGDLIEQILPNGIKTVYGYDMDGRLTSMTSSKSDGSLMQEFVYVLDPNGNRTKVTENLPGSVSHVTDYVYDALNRLEKVTYPDGKIVTYTYDDGGNRKTMLERADASNSGVLTTYFYGIENRLERLTRGTTEEFFYYDSHGNLASHVTPEKTTLYTFNLQNLLTKVDDGSTLTEFIYDGAGNRVAKIVNGVRTQYLVDTSSDLPQVLQEMDSSGAVTKSYTLGLSRVSARTPSFGSERYFLSDALGSTTALTNASAVVTDSFSYDAFGALLPPSTSFLQPFTYTGEQLDLETGLIYLRARYYDPILGRFISKDPVFGALDQTQSANPYPYVQNNPINFIDPMGLAREERRELSNPAAIFLHYWPPTGYLPLYHSQIIYDDGSNSGFFDDSTVRSDRANVLLQATYRVVGTHYPDDIVKEAQQNIKPGSYDFFCNNCQSYTKKIFDEAARIQEERERKKNYYNGNGPGGGGGGSSYSKPSDYNYWNSSRGGVLINKSATLLGENISQITGATLDPVTGQLILLGTNAASVPDVRMDDLISALRTVYSSVSDPGVTIDPQYSGNTMLDTQLVQYFGGVENTDLGYVVFEADRMMKALSAGKDNITGQPVSSNVPGYKSMLDRAIASGNGTGGSRFWFVPEIMDLTRSSDGKSFVFSNAKVKLLTEETFYGNGATDPDAQAFADHFTNNYDAYAQEFPIFERLRQVMKAIALARFIRDNNIPIDFSWLEDYQAPVVNTPNTTPTVFNSKTIQNGNQIITYYIEGGVEVGKPNRYLTDAGSSVANLSSTTLSARTTTADQTWQVTSGSNTYNAVALSLMPQRLSGNFVTHQTDLFVPTPGDLSLNLTRYYDSFESQKSPLGFGWKIDPYVAKFEKPAMVDSDLSSISLNGLRAGDVHIVDRQTGTEAIFRSAFSFSKTGEDTFTYSGRNIDGTVNFTAVDAKDGSTFKMNSDKTYTWTRLDGSKVLFDSNGRILKETDRFGKTLSYSYAGDRIVAITDSLNRSINLTYVNGRITAASGPLNLSMTYEYNTAGDLISVKDDRTGLTTTYSYDTSHQLTGSKDPFGLNAYGNNYDITGMASSEMDARGNVFNRTYDLALDKETIRNTVTGKEMFREYDSSQRITKETDYLENVTRYTYTGENRLPATVTDSKNHTITFNYNSNGQVTKIIDPDNLNSFGATMEFQYDSKGNVNWSRDTRNVIRTFIYDTVTSDLKEIRETLSSTETKITKFSYDASGNLTSILDANNRNQSYLYDALRNLTDIKDGLDNVVEHRSYDTLFRLTDVSDGLNRNTHFDYNNLDQMTQIKTALGTVNYHYDAKGNLDVSVDARTNPTTFTYDPTTGDLLQVIDPRGGISKYTYDSFGRLDSITDPNGQITVFDYDDLGRLVYVGADLILPEIKNQQISNNSDGSMTITVTASEKINEGSLLIREKGQSVFAEVPFVKIAENQIRVTLNSLKVNTDYEYSVKLTDRGKNQVIYGSFLMDRQAPMITTNQVTNLRALSGAFKFIADEPIVKATLKIAKISDGSERQIVYDLNSVNLIAEVGGLSASTGYEYQWELVDTAGNKTLSPKTVFTTLATDDPFFIENQVISTSVSFANFTVHLKLAQASRPGSIIYYRKVGTTSWASAVFANSVIDGNVSFFGVNLAPNTDYEYEVNIFYGSPAINNKTSQIQTFRTG